MERIDSSPYPNQFELDQLRTRYGESSDIYQHWLTVFNARKV